MAPRCECDGCRSGRTLAILDGSSSADEEYVPPAICTYAADGKAKDTIELPRGEIGQELAVLDGWFVFTGSRSALLVERHGDRRLRFPLEASKDKHASKSGFASPDGKELWLVDHDRRTLERFALP